MSRFDGFLTRFLITRERVVGGQALLSGGGRAAEGPTDVLWAQSHGFASRPPTGSQGFSVALAGRPSQLVGIGGEDPKIRPQLDPGNAVLYDHNGYIVKVFDEGLLVDVKQKDAEVRAKTFRVTSGGLEVASGGALEITVTGADAFIEVDPDKKLYLGGDPAKPGQVFDKVLTASGEALNVWARIS